MDEPVWDGVPISRIAERFRTQRLGKRLVYLDQTTSTQDVAREQALAGAPNGTLVLAEEQTRGRGRFQRTWVSPRGGAILMSLVLRPEPRAAAQLPILISLAVVKAVRSVTGLPAMIKWPNDVQIRGRKLAGILIDATGSDRGIDFAIVGIGLNVGMDPETHPDIAEIATSVSREAGRPAARLPILAGILEEIERLYGDVQQGMSLVPEWRQYLVTLGQRVVISRPGIQVGEVRVEEGVAEGVDETGALLLRRDDGSLVSLIGGEVSLRV